MKTQRTLWGAIFLALLVAALPVASQGPGQSAGTRATAAALPRALPRAAAIPWAVSEPRASAAAASVEALDRVPQMVSEVSTPAVMATIQQLESFQTRYLSTPNLEAAGEYLYSAFSALGLQVERDPFSAGGYGTNNIVATLPGKTDPAIVLIVGAHYDSNSDNPLVLAPGADDNASGTAVVLELARVLRNYQFDFTVKFVAFSAEEQWCLGSDHYASSAKLREEKILGAVALDQIGYVDREPSDLALLVNGASEWLANAFADAASRYAPLPTQRLALGSADHAPFWFHGYSAIGACAAKTVHPHYHKTTDTSSTLNTAFLGGVARATLATVATLAQPVSNPAPPVNVGVSSPRVVRGLFLRAMIGSVSWTPTSNQVASYNVYRSTQPHGAYQRINRSPVAGTSFVDRTIPAGWTFYYVVRAVDASGAESNASAPAMLTIEVG
jgi:hypothetical protein